MIFFAPNGQAAAPAVATAVQEHAFYGRTIQTQASEGPPLETELAGEMGDAFDPKPRVQDVVEDYDWNNPRLKRRFILLEQKFLAKKATREEAGEYQTMKRDRNGTIFAERQLRDYVEIQRLRKLSEKLAEVQRYLRPLEI